jgi:hypothetical protein
MRECELIKKHIRNLLRAREVDVDAKIALCFRVEHVHSSARGVLHLSRTVAIKTDAIVLEHAETGGDTRLDAPRRRNVSVLVRALDAKVEGVAYVVE